MINGCENKLFQMKNIFEDKIKGYNQYLQNFNEKKQLIRKQRYSPPFVGLYLKEENLNNKDDH